MIHKNILSVPIWLTFGIACLILLLMLILFVCSEHGHLDKFWMHRDVIYDFAADLTGIGDRSVCEIS